MGRAIRAKMHNAIMQAIRNYIEADRNGDKPEEIHDELGYFSGLIRAAKIMGLLNTKQCDRWEERVRGENVPGLIDTDDYSNLLWDDLGDGVY